jgi:xanthine dehydrogenase YagS FAD-binding subunit
VRPFRYERATDAAHAVALVSAEPEGAAAFLAGGTNLVDLMKLDVATPELLVDIARLPLDAIEETADGGLRIGATVRNADLAADRRVRTRYPLLAQALLVGASAQLRNVATVGGNLLQRTRCGYFQDVTKPCNKRRPGSGCAAREGHHRTHAILGHAEACIATHPSDMAVALAALDAVVHVEGVGGARAIPLADFYRPPGEDPQHETVLAHGELVTAVELPPLARAARSRYRKVRERAAFAFALVSVAAVVELDDDGIVRDCRVALGGVAPQPWRALRAEQALRGRPAGEASFAAAAEAELAAAMPLRDNGEKVPLARNLLVRTLTELCAR